jgi:hypothetical protein
MTVQQAAATRGANLVEAKRVRRIAAVAIGLAIELILIAAVLLSTIGFSPANHPTPAGAQVFAPLPALPSAH